VEEERMDLGRKLAMVFYEGRRARVSCGMNFSNYRIKEKNSYAQEKIT